jgi:hypothetical protein
MNFVPAEERAVEAVRVLKNSGLEGQEIVAAAIIVSFDNLADRLAYVAYGDLGPAGDDPGALERIATALTELARVTRDYVAPAVENAGNMARS